MTERLEMLAANPALLEIAGFCQAESPITGRDEIRQMLWPCCGMLTISMERTFHFSFI